MIFETQISEMLTAIQTYSGPLLHYGNIALFFLLAFGILALPIPDETLLLTAGFLIAKTQLNGAHTIMAAYLGAMFGITGSYLIGRFGGAFLLEKYGPRIGITEQRVARTRLWFKRIGMWALFFGYFIPGVRHLTGYLVGSVRIEYQKFALFAYSGALVWSSTFLTIGYALGQL